MFPDAETYYAAIRVERTLAPERAKRRARLHEASRGPRSDQAAASGSTGAARWDPVAHAIRSLCRVLRPAHA